MKYLKLFEEYVETLFEGVWVENKASQNVYYVKNFNPETQTKASKEQIEKAKESSSEISEKDINKQKKDVANMLQGLKEEKEETQQRGEHFAKLYDSYLNAKTEEDKVDALQDMAENGLIVGLEGGEKIYVTPNLPVKYKKLICGSGSGDKVSKISKEMNKLISKHNIDIEKTGGSNALADAVGKHNEAGMAFHLFQSDENKKNYESNRQKYNGYGGEEDERIDQINKKGADLIKASLPEGAVITGAKQVGGAKEDEKGELGIEGKDTTDVVVFYKDKDGKEHTAKFSAKIYANPKRITMRNSGTANAGEVFFGDAGKELDEFNKKLRSENDWKNAKTEKEAEDMRRTYRQEYSKEIQKVMDGLTKTEKGQKQLEKMWQEVHSCGKDVSTTVANRKTGEVELHSPKHYCEPKGPFKVTMNGSSLKIQMEGESNDYIEMVVKTEANSSPKLLVNHIKSTPKKEKKAKK